VKTGVAAAETASAAASAAELVEDLQWHVARLGDSSRHQWLVPFGPCASSATMARAQSDASGDEDGGACGLHIGELALHSTFAPGQLPDIARRALSPIVLPLVFYGRGFSGLTMTARADSRNVFAGVNNGISHNARLRQLRVQRMRDPRQRALVQARFWRRCGRRVRRSPRIALLPRGREQACRSSSWARPPC